MSDRSRKRDAAATREDILAAAKRHFTAKGYDGAGVREIAAEAGVNAALVNRYFESKEGLFEEAVLAHLRIDDLIEGDRSTFGVRVAEHFVDKNQRLEDDLDPTLAFVRSAGSEAVGERLRAVVEIAFVERLATWLGGRDAKQRAALILAQLLGFDMLNRMVQLSSLGPRNSRKAAERLAVTLQSYVNG